MHGFKKQEFYNYSSYISGSGVTESFLWTTFQKPIASLLLINAFFGISFLYSSVIGRQTTSVFRSIMFNDDIYTSSILSRYTWEACK